MRIKRTDAVIPKNTFHNYGIDALRIISMLMIVTHHVLSHGGILKSSESTNYWSAWLIEISVICAVNCYALISGYVGIYTKYKISNLAFLWCRVVFYAICITIVCKCLFPSTVSIRAIISSFIPIVSGEYWYFTAYALLFLFIPILNEGLNRLSKRKLTFLLISVIIVVSVIQPFACIIWTDISYLSEGYSTWWLMILYLIGGYIRKYGFFINRPTKTWVYTTVYLAFVFATWVSKMLMQYLSNQIWGEIKYDNILISYQSVTILGAAVALLLAFEKIHVPSCVSQVVSFFAPLAFSVYLIHDHPQIRDLLFINRFIWIAKLPLFQMIPCIIGIALAVFFICSFIDVFRQQLFRVTNLKEKLWKLENIIKNKIFISNKT